MRALVLKKHGSPDDALAVEQRPDPSPGEGQVKIKVRACGINFADLLARVGLYPDAPKPPCVMGYEVAGEIDELGPGVNGFAPGQRVFAATRFTGFAELAVADLANVLALPDRFSFEQGAALPVNYGTAYAAIVLLADVQHGETVLVHAAAGGVGIAALQLLRDRGAEAIGTASASKHEFIRGQGAAHTIDYRTRDVSKDVKRITDSRGVDVVLDSLGEFKQSLSLLRPNGRVVMYGVSNLMAGDRRRLGTVVRGMASIAGNLPRFNAIKLMNGNQTKKVGDKSMMGLNALHWWDDKGSLEELTNPLVGLIEQGVIEPVVAESFPFERAAEAHRYIQDRRNIGKVVLTP
ncbi:MAG: zinc-binding dehydrogenase [Solirubrobacterales bacterium]